MAPIVRRTFEELRDEALDRLGKNNPPVVFSNRVEQVMTSAYYDLSMTFHHYELHATFSDTLAAAASQIAIPDDLYIIMVIELFDGQDTTKIDTLVHQHLYSLIANRDFKETAQPIEYARSEEFIEFNTAADVGYTARVLYYKQPTAPDFDPAAASSELEWLWDEYIIQRTLALFWPSAFRFDFAQVAQQTMGEFLQRQIQLPLQTGIRDFPQRLLSDEAVGGNQ